MDQNHRDYVLKYAWKTYSYNKQINSSEIIRRLKSTIRKYMNIGEKAFKVGVTINPPRRFGEHLNDDPGWREMRVIYRTTSRKMAKRMETELVDYGRSKFYNRSWNHRRGGCGIQKGHRYYYLYILMDY